MNIKKYELSIKPYPGKLYITGEIKTYKAIYKKLSNVECKLEEDLAGYTSRGCFDGVHTYLVYATDTCSLIHELSHAALFIFKRCGINPVKANGEPFCYFLDNLFKESMSKLKFKTN